jgi:4-carboxymuconolactone decarboxylase
MGRLAPRRRGDLDDEGLRLYDSIVGGPRASGPQLFDLTDSDGALHGPFGPLLLQPTLGAAVSALGEAVRYGTQLSGPERELAILAVAVHCCSDFEWYAHVRVARHVGLTDEQIEDVGRGLPVRDVSAREAAVLAVTESVLVGDPLSDDLYGQIAEVLDEVEVFEVACLVGYYRLLAGVMSVFAVGTPDGAERPPWW